MIHTLAEKHDWDFEKVLDFPLSVTRLYLTSEEDVHKSDKRKEAEIRANLEYYKDRRMLRAKFQHQLDEHLSKTGSTDSHIVETLMKQIVARISNG